MMRFKAAAIHLGLTGLIGLLVTVLIFMFWYPGVYSELSGGFALLAIIMAVDLVCGPLITLIVFNPKKPKSELWRDLTLVAVMQVGALAYGIHTVWVAKPLFLVLEVDRFKVITAPQVDNTALEALHLELRPSWLSIGPKVVAIRAPLNSAERNKVTLEAVEGGRDYAERPEFYTPYTGDNALTALKNAKPLAVFLKKRPDQLKAAQRIALEQQSDLHQWFYLPVMARQDWVAILDKQGHIQGFLKGDGF